MPADRGRLELGQAERGQSGDEVERVMEGESA
jgi:hypothetical protein